jgi:hypothetical protein
MFLITAIRTLRMAVIIPGRKLPQPAVMISLPQFVDTPIPPFAGK